MEDAIRAAAVAGPLGRSQLFARYSATRNIPAGPPLLAALLHGNAARGGTRYTLSHPFMLLFVKHKYKLQHGMAGRMAVGSAAAYRRAVDEARAAGVGDVPSYTTATRELARQLAPATRRYLEEGGDGLRKTIARGARDRSGLEPLARIEADQHVLNWWVEFGDGGRGKMTGIFAVDAASGFLLGSYLDRTERAFGYRRLFAEVALAYGVRRDGTTVAVDNGPGAAYSNMTRSRRRFVGSQEQADRRPVGSLEKLGYTVDPQPPRHPWLKGTIESMNRLLDEELRAHPDLPGTAYLGNSPGDRPEHGGTVGVPEAVIRRAVADVVAQINRMASPAPDAAGLSREAYFRARLAGDVVVKVDELYAGSLCYPSVFCRVDKDRGWITLHKNVYHSYETAGILMQATTKRAREVEVFYDDGPGGLLKGVWVHRVDDQGYLCHVPLMEARVGDVDRLRAHGQARRAYTKAVKESARQLAAAVAAAPELAADAGLTAPAAVPAAAVPAAARLARFMEEFDAADVTPARTTAAPAPPTLRLIRPPRRASA